MESSYFISQYKINSTGTTVDTLTIERVNNYFLPLPPLAEQERIVEKVDEIMKFVNKLHTSDLSSF